MSDPVSTSHPGLFTDAPPYSLDLGVRSNLDNLWALIARAHRFAVIYFREVDPDTPILVGGMDSKCKKL